MKDKTLQSDVTMENEEFLESNGQAPTNEGSKASRKPKTGKAIKSRFVRVRKAPSSSSPAIAIMNLGDQADILDRLPGYYKIKTKNDNHIGYVSSNYFQED